MRPPEAPHRRVVRAGGLVGGVEIAEAEAHPAEPDLGGKVITHKYRGSQQFSISKSVEPNEELKVE